MFEEFFTPLQLSRQHLISISEIYRTEMQTALTYHNESRNLSSLLMEITFVTKLCTGKENGHCLGLDLGGTNFRVVYLLMDNGKCVKERIFSHVIPSNVLCGNSDKVFDFIANALKDAVLTLNLEQTAIPLGFTFSFPMRQQGLSSGILLTWTKSFKCVDGVGSDAVVLLQSAMATYPELSKISVVAILNDTTGVLVGGSFVNPLCRIGVVLGTGFNVCYLEESTRIKKMENIESIGEYVIIDTESGGFGDNHILDSYKTPRDIDVDNLSNHPSSYTFEKLISGMYLGEIFRQFLFEAVKKQICGDSKFSTFAEPFSFTTPSLTTLHSCTGLPQIKDVFATFRISLSDEEAEFIKTLTNTIFKRAAGFLAAVFVPLIGRSYPNLDDPIFIAFDGSLFRGDKKFQELIHSEILSILPDIQLQFVDAIDGSGKGAALLASII